MRCILVWLFLFIVGPTLSIGQKELQGSELIDALTSTPFLVIYSEDGAADETVVKKPHPDVNAIVKLGARAIPLLISHLDDTRLTAAKFDGGFSRGKLISVTVGYVCLDILTQIIRNNPTIYYHECFDDGLGACIKSEYYFRPDEYYPAGSNYIAREGVQRVKLNWNRAYRKGLIKYKPSYNK